MIPIKAAVLLFFLSRVGGYFFSLCCFSLKEYKLCHLSVDYVIVFYIYTIIYSLEFSFKPE